MRAEIVEREKAETALIQSRKMEAMGQLMGGIAHDFNNLLQMVSGSLDLIANRCAGDERARHLTATELAAVDRGRQLTSQLLSFSRVQRIELKPVNVATFVAGMKELLGRTIEPSVRISFDPGDAPASMTADVVQLELALLNLALNARDAMPDGGDLRISFRHQLFEGRDDVEDGEYLGIAVRDTGTGIDPHILPRVFEPFFTTKALGRGSGLSLSMVFGMARQSGGTVTIESTAGKGTAVTIFLRAAASAEPEPEAARALARGDLESFVGLKVLIVDDEPIVREVVADMLGAMNCRVLTAPDGKTAIELVEHERPAAVLLDFAMPDMNGAEVARAMLARWPDTRIMFATGFAQSDAIDAAAGDDAIILHKPFSPKSLAAALQRAIER